MAYDTVYDHESNEHADRIGQGGMHTYDEHTVHMLEAIRDKMITGEEIVYSLDETIAHLISHRKRLTLSNIAFHKNLV